jgi:hypothetical protein
LAKRTTLIRVDQGLFVLLPCVKKMDMSEARKLGLQISLGSGPIHERLTLAKEAEDLGYSSLWVAEVSGADALVSPRSARA